MNRKDFLRNTMMAFAISLVPKILQPSIPKLSRLIAGYTKISKQMMNDIPYMEWFTKNIAVRNLKKVEGYDSSEPVEVQIVEDFDDYTRNTKTVIVSQFV